LAKQDKTLATTQAILDASGSAATMVSTPFRSPVFDVSIISRSKDNNDIQLVASS
jgi:hypothetical protein